MTDRLFRAQTFFHGLPRVVRLRQRPDREFLAPGDHRLDDLVQLHVRGVS